MITSTSAVTCAKPDCDTPRPANATARWRFCSTACKQAAYRVRCKGSRAEETPAALATLDEELHAAAIRLLMETYQRVEQMGDGEVPRSQLTAGLVELARHLTEVAVARDRAAGVPWSTIGNCLDIQLNTVRRKFGAPAAEKLAQFHLAEPESA
ncbi:hypothetical protein JOF53_007276 [Crossiella equi]|uniref:Helix-turn-helix DNA binding domain protein n=1 Tax=Crossiella equi TaxID=130796 RepID=A0ABS5AQB1_9PSEU|nr:hypothetical protein [Crossiella equi]MBP2478404.1 hypothetical protein [Crossiella equi]